MSGGLLCDVPVHNLAAGSNQLLQSSRNAGGLEASSFSHLHCRLRLRQGARHLLLGRNGCGKTTLLREIASGRLDGFPDGLRTHLVAADQSLDPDMTVLEATLAADVRVHCLWQEAAKLDEECATLADEAALETAGNRLCEIYELLGELCADDEDQWRRRAAVILQGLGFEAGTHDRLIGSLSGGWQVRVRLATALFGAPELLLLDEPTNHLDLAAIDWLQNYLTHHFCGTLVCVSHDRRFVEEVATEIIILDSQKLYYFNGPLDSFEKQALQRSKMIVRQAAALDSKKEHERSAIKCIERAVERHESTQESNKENMRFVRLGGGLCNARESKQSSQVAQRIRRLNRMGIEKSADGAKRQGWTGFAFKDSRLGAGEGGDDDDNEWEAAKIAAAPSVLLQEEASSEALQFPFVDPEPLGVAKDVPIVELSDVSFRHSPTDVSSGDVLENVDLSVSSNSRIAVMGNNGAGKTTLLSLLTGELVATSGIVRQQRGCRVAHFTQHHAEMLLVQYAGRTALDYMMASFPRQKDYELMEQLEAFGIDEALATLPIEVLSGGQRVRTVLARISAEEPHVLVMDEPTNHLDIYSIDALTAALNHFEGAVVLATHNRDLLEQVATEFWTVADRNVKKLSRPG